MEYLPLSVYATELGELVSSRDGDFCVLIRKVTNNSAEVESGSLFCAIRGAVADGHDFLPQAIASGASAVVVADDKEYVLPDGIAVLRVKDSYYAWGILCQTFAGFPARDIQVYGVTGTNGKTSIAFMLRRIFRAASGEEKCGLLSTVEYDTGSGEPEESARTTPDSKSFQTLFGKMRAHGCRRAVMELSSHGLHQHRTGSLCFAGAVFTNLTGDHLDYHKTMEAYFQAKRQLFTEMLQPSASAVINVDDPYGKRLFQELTGREAVYGVTLKEDPAANVFVRNLSLTSGGTVFTLFFGGMEIEIRTVLIGEHNVCNLALAGVLALSCGVQPDVLRAVLSDPEIAPPGRLEPFDFPSGVRAFVDYAHTDDALLRVLTALRATASGRVITVFGCGGDRDRSKRPRMGAAAASLSDLVIVTSDNPRTEDPLAIIREIENGMQGKEYLVEPDRAAAIALAVKSARKNDLILIAGKGHENYQEINGVRYPLDDREILRGLQK